MKCDQCRRPTRIVFGAFIGRGHRKDLCTRCWEAHRARQRPPATHALPGFEKHVKEEVFR